MGYFAWNFKNAKYEIARKSRQDMAISEDVSAISKRNDQNGKISDLSSAIIQMKINLDIMMDDFNNNRVQTLEDVRDMREELESLYALIRAVGDSSEMAQQEQKNSMRLIKKETDVRLEKLLCNVDSLKNVLKSQQLENIDSTIKETESINKLLATVENEKITQ